MLHKSTKSFFNLLQSELNKTQNENIQKCLISNEPLLHNTKITLLCKHSFNYEPLFKEIKIQKTRFNNLETQRLKTYQIKCPYCRTTQNGILPYKTGYSKIDYVNWPEKYAYKPYKCGYIFLSGKKKGHSCNRPCSEKHCKQHIRIIQKRKLKQISLPPVINEKISINTITNSFFLECKKKYKNWIKNNISPTLHHTKNYSYFKCRCQHIINKGKKNERQCSKFMICSDKFCKNNTISPKFYRIYLCNTHNYKDVELQKKNTYNNPDNIYIDLLNIPEHFNIDNYNTFLSTFYNTYFNSNKYIYHKFIKFENKHSINTIVL
tara:strand:+ start:603 stop:1565 length:963 start_codon:yes stop_codon:yes gene_type:complete